MDYQMLCVKHTVYNTLAKKKGPYIIRENNISHKLESNISRENVIQMPYSTIQHDINIST